MTSQQGSPHLNVAPTAVSFGNGEFQRLVEGVIDLGRETEMIEDVSSHSFSLEALSAET